MTCTKCLQTKDILTGFYKTHTMVNYYKECKKCRNAKPNTAMGFASLPLDVKLRTIELMKDWPGRRSFMGLVQQLVEEFPDNKLNYPKVYSWQRNGMIEKEKIILNK
jgi:hypothetical protein